MFRMQSTKIMLAAATTTVALLAGCSGSSSHDAAGASKGAGAAKNATPVSAVAPAAANSSGGNAGSPSSACDFLKGGPFGGLSASDSASSIVSQLRAQANSFRTQFPAQLHDAANVLASMLDEGASKIDGGAKPDGALVASIVREHNNEYEAAMAQLLGYMKTNCEPHTTAP
jgi:hypothetical protein